MHELARLLQNQEWNGALPYLDQRRLDMLEEALSRSGPTSALPSGATTPAPSSTPTWRGGLPGRERSRRGAGGALPHPERGRPRAGLCGLER
ncbi:hypothetical protein M5E87_13965 [Flavonifractor plautii]|nr:hypothetical protein M5E87_13965 [Flavonifractor plautii]